MPKQESQAGKARGGANNAKKRRFSAFKRLYLLYLLTNLKECSKIIYIYRMIATVYEHIGRNRRFFSRKGLIA